MLVNLRDKLMRMMIKNDKMIRIIKQKNYQMVFGMKQTKET
jgi:hypothetical protein